MVKILYCASNWRSALASKALMEMGFTNIMHVKGGFQALIDAGFSIQKVEAKIISIIRVHKRYAYLT